MAQKCGGEIEKSNGGDSNVAHGVRKKLCKRLQRSKPRLLDHQILDSGSTPLVPTLHGVIWRAICFAVCGLVLAARQRRNVAMIIALLLILASPPAPGADAAPSHDRAFWRSIIEHDYQPPAGASVPALARELSSMLGSREPEVRDETAYAILTAWIYQKHLIDGPVLLQLVGEWTTNLTTDIGSTGKDTVLRRSFSALMLSVVVARDNADPFLDAAEVRTLLDAALIYLRDEKDVRGYDRDMGWLHSAAHTADLLKFLARSRFVTREDQARILDAIGAKVYGAGIVFDYGEDERFARAVVSIVNRADFDRAAFKTWVTRITPAPLTARPDPVSLPGRQNVKNLFSKLYVILATAPQQTESAQAGRDSLANALKSMY